MKGYGTGSTPQMVVQAITGVLGGNNTAAGAFSGELAARYIIDNYYGGLTDNLSEQERQQISMLATIASGIAGGLAGNSTASAGMGAQAGKNGVENNSLSLGSGMGSYVNAAASWNQFATTQGLSPEETQAGLDKIAKGELPEGANIAKVIVEGYQDGVMIAGAWYLGPAAAAGKVVGGGLLGLAANSGYQYYDLSQPQNANKSWDYLGSAASFTTDMMAPGRGVLANTGRGILYG